MTDKPAATESLPAAAAASADPDPALDITSEHFDPLRALYASGDLIKPVKNARLYDNVDKYETTINVNETTEEEPKAVDGTSKAKTQASASGAAPAKPGGKSVAATAELFQRKFQPHQLMIPGTGPKARHQRNLLDKLQHDTKFEGPLAAVRQLMVAGQRVRVVTRNAAGVDGHLVGYIEMFDKHWNIALRDVLEVRRRRRPGQCAVAAVTGQMGEMSVESQQSECNAESNAEICARRLRELRLRQPETQVRQLNRKWVELTRRLAGVMVRGEQVVLVTAAAAATDGADLAVPPSKCDGVK